MLNSFLQTQQLDAMSSGTQREESTVLRAGLAAPAGGRMAGDAGTLMFWDDKGNNTSKREREMIKNIT